MNSLLINPYPYSAKGINSSTLYPPLGLLYLGNIAKKLNLQAKVIDMNALRIKNEEFIISLKGAFPDLIGISANVITFRSALELSRALRRSGYTGILVAGGPMPTVMPEIFLNDFDIVVRNEGEVTFKKILDNEPLENIDGISFKKGGKIIHNNSAKLITDLDTLPFPDYSLL